MKKLFLYVFLGLISLFLVSCVGENSQEFLKLPHVEKTRIYDTRDARINIFEGDKNLVYVGVWQTRLTAASESTILVPKIERSKIKTIASITCAKRLNLNQANKISTRVMTKEETKKYKLWLSVYYVFECKKSSFQIAQEKQAKENRTKSGSTNTLNRTFICKYQKYPDEKSKIVIRGNTAQETTAIGVIINYSRVEYNNGNFTLTLPSKQNRAWFISPGNSSTMLIGAEINMYNCN